MSIFGQEHVLKIHFLIMTKDIKIRQDNIKIRQDNIKICLDDYAETLKHLDNGRYFHVPKGMLTIKCLIPNSYFFITMKFYYEIYYYEIQVSNYK